MAKGKQSKGKRPDESKGGQISVNLNKTPTEDTAPRNMLTEQQVKKLADLGLLED